MIKKIIFNPESDFVGKNGMEAIENKLNELVDEVNLINKYLKNINPNDRT